MDSNKSLRLSIAESMAECEAIPAFGRELSSGTRRDGQFERPALCRVCSSQLDEHPSISEMHGLHQVPENPPLGYTASEGEWIWMTESDWELLERNAKVAVKADQIIKAQRSVVEAKQKEQAKVSGDLRHSSMLAEMEILRKQVTDLQKQNKKLEDTNEVLLKNCHFLHMQNLEIKKMKVIVRPARNSTLSRSRLGKTVTLASSESSVAGDTSVDTSSTDSSGAEALGEIQGEAPTSTVT